ncbi:MAG: EFR1 family ferrodoxin [Lachnospiraceae bacterium]
MMEKKVEIVFSPTGGTRSAVQEVSSGWDLPKESIDLCVEEANNKDFIFSGRELCIIGVPSYGGRVPDIARQRILNLNGNHASAILIVSYGNRAYDDTLLELKEIAEKANFIVVAAISAVTEHSIMHQFGTGRPNASDRRILKEFAEKIKEKTEKESNSGEISVPGKVPYRNYDGIALKPKASKKCTNCGICASHCPVGAIDKENCRLTNVQLCISCMSCIEICPQKARSLNKLIKMAAGKKLKNVCSNPKENELFI